MLWADGGKPAQGPRPRNVDHFDSRTCHTSFARKAQETWKLICSSVGGGRAMESGIWTMCLVKPSESGIFDLFKASSIDWWNTMPLLPSPRAWWNANIASKTNLLEEASKEPSTTINFQPGRMSKSDHDWLCWCSKIPSRLLSYSALVEAEITLYSRHFERSIEFNRTNAASCLSSLTIPTHSRGCWRMTFDRANSRTLDRFEGA